MAGRGLTVHPPRGKEEKRLRACALQSAFDILENITDAFVVVDRAWRLSYLNQRARSMARLQGRDPEEMLGKDLWRELPRLEGTVTEQQCRQAMASQVAAEFETYYSPLDNWLRIRIFPARDGLAICLQDITSGKQAAHEREMLLASERAARAEAERMSEMRDIFLASITHELRAPLHAIFGWTKFLKRGGVNEAELRKGLEVIERNVHAQTHLIEDLLDMSRITAGKMRLNIQPLDPACFIEQALETVRPAADAKGIRLRIALSPDPGIIHGDADRLQQAVWNLLSNAIKFTPREGQVWLALDRCGSSHIEISVADNGVGIAPDFLPYVFERFRQADMSSTHRFSGLGLGLSIVKNLVELHGGTVQASSPGLGEGARFCIQLPQRQPACHACHEAGPSAAAPILEPALHAQAGQSG